VAVVGIPFLLLVLIWAPDWATMVLTAGMCAIGAYELMHAVAGEKGKRLIPLTVLAAALVPVLTWLAYQWAQFSWLGGHLPRQPYDTCPVLAPMAMVFLFLLFLYAILHYGKDTAIPFASLTAAVFAGLVFPLMLSCLLRLRLLENGTAWVFVPLCICFGSDTFALFGGMLFGKHKLAPRVSPKKTVEGGIGGLVGGVFGMALFKLITDALRLPLDAYTEYPAGITWGCVLVLGLAGSAVSQIGDLSFSVIKREFGVKDYGKLLPGHGGILDRFDSVTFVVPFVWFILEYGIIWMVIT